MPPEIRKLDSAPSSVPQLLRAALASAPLVDRLPVIGIGGERAADVPELVLELDAVGIEALRLAEYCRVCGFALRDTLPLTYPHILGFPLQMALLNEPKFPFGPIGLVHIANKITRHRPIGGTEKLDLRVSATKLEPHPKGRTFSLITEARVDGELVWEGVSTTLRRGGGGESGAEGTSGAAAKKPTTTAAAPELGQAAEWTLRSDLGRRYASVSGDRNPIHLYDLTAKALGFKKAIVHGMWTKARCLAQIESELPDAVVAEVAFKLPIFLPATVVFASGEAKSRRKVKPIAFEVRSPDGKPHLQGSAGAI